MWARVRLRPRCVGPQRGYSGATAWVRRVGRQPGCMGGVTRSLMCTCTRVHVHQARHVHAHVQRAASWHDWHGGRVMPLRRICGGEHAVLMPPLTPSHEVAARGRLGRGENAVRVLQCTLDAGCACRACICPVCCNVHMRSSSAVAACTLSAAPPRSVTEDLRRRPSDRRWLLSDWMLMGAANFPWSGSWSVIERWRRLVCFRAGAEAKPTE